MDVEMWMYVEYLEAKEYINATKKRKKQSSSEWEHKGIDPLRISEEASSSYRLREEEAE